ncbi:hypothetical protein O6072_25475 [Mycolicibacterium neoaurum]|uniref:hypothetical protein n=1 Tax=Mycolicibacterium neoaurum TaxID=1795 RepID=UPI00248D2C12|nr:hypothetical protein [Mycolicibacterium neoaurum]MDO3398452.1 hypothetical protein [Mycolicibacterium neoaurum]WBP94306.1 hypothetical protein O7W24_24845 [Mycolicibacterium neoaurum]WBS08112.1 hypothetical protein O6072_25475 [Mycolicibacterium neoaurum]
MSNHAMGGGDSKLTTGGRNQGNRCDANNDSVGKSAYQSNTATPHVTTQLSSNGVEPAGIDNAGKLADRTAFRATYSKVM